jgi:hypothetical protein
VVVLSYRYWQERFGGDRTAVGSFLEIARHPTETYYGPPGRFFGQPQAEPELDKTDGHSPRQ